MLLLLRRDKKKRLPIIGLIYYSIEYEIIKASARALFDRNRTMAAATTLLTSFFLFRLKPKVNGPCGNMITSHYTLQHTANCVPANFTTIAIVLFLVPAHVPLWVYSIYYVSLVRTSPKRPSTRHNLIV